MAQEHVCFDRGYTSPTDVATEQRFRCTFRVKIEPQGPTRSLKKYSCNVTQNMYKHTNWAKVVVPDDQIGSQSLTRTYAHDNGTQ